MRALAFAFCCLFAVSAVAKEKHGIKAPGGGSTGLSPACLNYTNELKAARSIDGASVYPIEGKDVERFLHIFNEREPKTDYKADHILVATSPDVAFVELFAGGCVNHSGKLAAAAFDSLMNAAFGDEIPGGTWL